MKILITGSNGFIGKNLIIRLQQDENLELYTYDLNNTEKDLIRYIKDADLIYHLAGVNRPEKTEEFYQGNSSLTDFIVKQLLLNNKTIPVVLSSSIQAENDNDYGKSKRLAENSLMDYLMQGGQAYIYRLSNVFGKWCRPNYNSVVATFCNNIANDLPIKINDPKAVVTLNYIDDIVDEFLSYSEETFSKLKLSNNPLSINESYSITLSELSEKLESFKSIKKTRILPDLNDEFSKKLYSTYLSYLPYDERKSDVDLKKDDRGNLFELIKSPNAGQIFVSKTKPGITRGNHYHHTKVEKFCVISGEASVKMRKITGNEIEEYHVNGDFPVMIDIPPGYTHNITNTGSDELITLFWANEIFDPSSPDTFFKEV
jgi:UDP-2-acetamido-2,6-beta-L-arabino-hexul-4-ose reductase